MIEKLGHYKITSELGRGGMGVVYKAYEESLNRYVAIKVLGEHLSHDESFVKRFVREAKAAAALSHPNVIQIFYIGHDAPPDPNPHGQEGRHYFVMEFVEGRSVHDVLEQEGALDPLRAARIVQQAASGLAVAHDQGLVHRDIKPANLLVTKDERVKIADFGLALAPTDGATRLTATNSLMGTPGYLSPEQCCGEPAGPRSDIYSLGMTFYEMLTGSMPFKGESPLAVLRQILDEEPPALLQVDPDLDPRIASVVERMVAKEPNDRYQTCHQLVADLDEILGTTRSGVLKTGGVRAAALPPLPGAGAPSPTAAATQAKVTGLAQDAPTLAAQVPPQPVARPPAALPPVAPPVVAASAAAKSGKGGRWVVIGVMAVMLVIAVSAAGLYLAAPILRDAPFLRDIPFLKDASSLKQSADHAAVDGESVAANAGVASDQAPRVAETRENAGTFETKLPAQNDSQPDGSERDTSANTAAGANNAAGNTGVGAARVADSAPAVAQPAPAPAVAQLAPAPAERAPAVAERAPARAAAPPARAPIRANPRIAVIAVGEPMFAGAAEQALESQLARHGLDLYDERGIIELRDAGGASQIAPSSLLGMVANRGVDVLVLIDVEPMGQRELDALGRYAYATTSRVRVDAYLAADGGPVGRGWSEQVEYAEPNAQRKADGSMGGFSTQIAEAIDAAWQDHRSGAR